MKAPAAAVYGTLFRQQVTEIGDVPSQEFPGFLAEGFELTPDGLTLTLTIREGAHFIPPGPEAVQPTEDLDRPVDSEDVAFSIRRFLGEGSVAPAPNAAQLEFIDEIETPDARTAVVRLGQTYARAIWRLADTGNLVIMPREAGRAFDPAETMVGSGPFRWNGFDGEADPVVAARLLRNDDWWGGPDTPYVDGIVWTVLGPAAQLEAFRSGDLDVLDALSETDIEGLLEAVPEADVFPRRRLGFAYLARGEPRDDGSPLSDPRVRQAISLALDRGVMTEAVYRVTQLRDLGFDIRSLVGWHNMLPAGYAGQSLNPRSDDATGALIRTDPAEARKLLDAAGHDDLELPYHYTTAYGPGWAVEADLVPTLLEEVDITLETVVDELEDYAGSTFRGDFEGLSFQLQAFPDLGDYLQEMYLPGSGRNHSRVDDQAIVDAAAEISAILDTAERDERIREVQRELLVEPMWYVPTVGWQIGWAAWNPRLQSAGPERHTAGHGGEILAGFPGWWIDETRAP